MSLPFSVIDYFPPNLRDQELFKQFSSIFQAGLDNRVTSDLNSQSSIWDVSSPHHDSDYIISLIGGDAIYQLLADKIDVKSLEMLLPGIFNLRGTAEGFELLLRLLKIDFESYYLTKERNGCYMLTIVVSSSVVLNLRDLPLLEKLSQSFLSTCVKLRGITNCYEHRNDMNNGMSLLEIDIGIHRLDDNFTLDRSVMDMPIGSRIGNSGLLVKLCYNYKNYIDVQSTATVMAKSTITTVVPMFLDARNKEYHLDRTVTLDLTSKINTTFAYCL